MQQRIKKGIEEGDGLPDIASIPHTLDSLRAGGELEIFTPNYFFLVRRPA